VYFISYIKSEYCLELQSWPNPLIFGKQRKNSWLSGKIRKAETKKSWPQLDHAHVVKGFTVLGHPYVERVTILNNWLISDFLKLSPKHLGLRAYLNNGHLKKKQKISADRSFLNESCHNEKLHLYIIILLACSTFLTWAHDPQIKSLMPYLLAQVSDADSTGD